MDRSSQEFKMFQDDLGLKKPPLPNIVEYAIRRYLESEIFACFCVLTVRNRVTGNQSPLLLLPSSMH